MGYVICRANVDRVVLYDEQYFMVNSSPLCFRSTVAKTLEEPRLRDKSIIGPQMRNREAQTDRAGVTGVWISLRYLFNSQFSIPCRYIGSMCLKLFTHS